MSQNVDFLSLCFRFEEFIDQPIELAKWIGQIQQQPEVVIVAIVHVERDDAKAWEVLDHMETPFRILSITVLLLYAHV